MQKRKAHPLPIIADELYDDEVLHWQGQPSPRSALFRVQWGSVIMGLAVMAFAIFFLVMSQNAFNQTSFTGRSVGPPTAFRLFFLAIPGVICLTGLWQAAAPIRQAFTATRTYYALTNKRAIVIMQTASKQVRSYYDEHINRIQTRSYGDGSGDVIFSTHLEDRTVYRNKRSYTQTVTVQDGFFGIRDAREVEDLLTQIFIEQKPPNAETAQ